MTLLEYVQSLQDQGEKNITSKVEKWKEENQPATKDVVETEVLEEVDLGTVKTKDGAVGASAPSVGPQLAPETTELTLEDGFSVSPEVKLEDSVETFNIDGNEVTKDEFDEYSAKKAKEKEIATMSFGEKLLVDFKKGSTTLGEMIASVPETIYDLFALPQNLLANATGLDIETSAEKFKEKTGLENPVLEFYEAESAKLQESQDIYNKANYDHQGIYKNFEEGNYADGFKQLASGLAESAPVSISMMVGGAAVSTGKLAAGSTIAFAGPEIKEQREKNIGQSEAENIIKGLGLAGAESVFSSIGTGTIGKVYKDILIKEGKEEGIKIFRQGLVDMYRSALTKFGAPASMVGEGVEEVATTITQNMINGVDPFENVADSFIQGIGGGLTYGAPVNTAQAVKAVKSGITNLNINKELKISDSNNVIEAFSPETPTSEAEVKISQIPGSLNAIDAKADKQVEVGDITVDQANDVKLRAREVQGSVNRLKPLGISLENQPAIVDLMIEQKKLKNTIKQVDNSSLTKTESERLSEIDKELSDIIVADKTAKVEKGAKVIAEQVGTGFETFENEADVASAIETLKEQGGNIDTKSSEDYGTFVVMPDGKRIIILNKESAAQDNVMTTAQHEVGHAVLFETVKNKPEAAIALGTSLLEELKNSKDITFTSSKFLNRFNQYVEDADISKADTMEEVLTLASEGLESGDIVFNEKATTKIGDFIRRALSAMGLNVKFKTGKDVLNFVRDYNRSVQKGKGLSKGLEKAAVEGAKVDIKAPTDIEAEITEVVTKESKKDTGVIASTKVQEIYDTQGEAGAFDIIDQFKPIVNRIVEKRRDAPNFDRQLLTDEIETGKRGIFDLIREYKPESGVPLAAYINKFLPARAIEASKRVLGEEFTSDVTEAKGVMAEEVTTEVAEKPVTRKIKPSSFISNEAVTKIKEQVQEKIKGIDPKNLTFKKLGDLAPEIIAQELGIPVKKLTSPTANLSKGDATAIQQFVNKNADKLLKILPEGAVVEAATDKLLGTSTGVPKGLLNAFYTKQARLGKGAGLAPFKLNKGISKADFLETFGIVEGKKAEGFDARSPQAQALKGIASLYGKLVTNEIVRSDTDLSLEAKQDVAAGKNKAMASKRTQKLNWKETDEAIVASFKIGDRTYKTTLEETAFMEFDEGQTYQDIEDIAKDLDILEDAEGNPIESSENFYHLEFGDTELGKGITGKGNAFEVFTTTMNGVVDYLKANPSIEGVVFTAKEPSRIRLYKTLSQVLAGKLNGSSGFKNDTFIVSTKPATVSKPKSMASKRPDIKSRFNTASTTKTGGVSKANNVQPISRGSVEYMGGKGGLKTETRWTPSKKDIEYIPTFMNKAASLFDKDFFTTGNFAFGGRSLIGTKSDLTKALEGAVYNKDAPKMPKRKPYKKTKKYDKNFHEKLNTKEFLDNEKAKMPYLKFIFEQIQADLKSNPNHLKYWEAVLNDAQNSQGHFMRFLAPIAFYPVDKNGNPVFDQDIVEEHTMPQSNVAAFLLQSALDGNIEQDFGFIEDNYFQGALLLADDKKTRGKDYNYVSNMGETFLESDNPSSWMRYNNENVNANQGGIDFNAYKLLNGQTIAESLDAGLPLKDRTLDALENQRNEILKQLKDPSYKAKEAIKVFKELAPGKAMASKRDSDLIPDAIKYDRPITVQTAINALAKTDKALELARKLDQPVKKIRVFDFDDTLARTKSNVLYTMPDGTTGAIDAATFAKEAGNMEAEGAQWDFSEFSKVMQGSKGPLLDVAKIIADKRGTKDVFVLTARPANAAGPIKEFLASMGLDIPLANITGLGDGAPAAKAGWIMGKAAEGYNDFYFADDHTGNVKAVKDVLSQIDVKSKVQLAKASKRATFDTIVNDMIENSSGIETYKKYSAARAQTVGASKGKYNFLIPPSAEDFTGLLYKMLGKGKKGDAQMAFLKTNLLDPYNRAESAVTQAKISAANDFKALKNKLKTLPKTLSKQTGIGKFTYSHAVRVAAWTKQGMDIPGLSKRDVKELVDFVNKDAKLRVFTDELINIQKGKEYPKPGKTWLGGNITTDIIGGINKVNRAEYQQEWRENLDIIFSEDNMNKMEAAYGTRWREAMEDSIRRMKSGSNRPIGGNRVTEGLLNWLNNSVGAVMFLNTRSALLQTISAVNFINLSDNNIVKAGVAFANQKQFWGDFMTLMNSDYLVERRNGLKINVSESEIADAVREAQNKPKAAIAFLLSKGFVMTRFADSFAIASGGSTFYRNRVNKYVKEGVEQSVAEKQAFEDFKAIAETSQQSSSPSKISQQQASAAGRVILAWANTPMQYARIQKRAGQDLINGRGDWKTNVSKIVYYGAIQNLIFNALQSAAFALGFGDDDEEDEVKAKKKEEKAYTILNGMIDSQLKGLGIFGAASVAMKNTLMTLYKEHNKKGSKYENAVEDLEGFSPPLGSKIGKITGGLRSFSWNKKDIKEKGFSLDNPAYIAGAQVVTGLTNIPFDRVMKKINNIRGIVNERSALWQKVALGLGWSTWDVDLGYYGGFDKEEPLTPKQQLKLEVDTMKKDTNKPDQVKILLDFGLTKKQIRELKNENNRVKKILELQKKDKNAGSKK